MQFRIEADGRFKVVTGFLQWIGISPLRQCGALAVQQVNNSSCGKPAGRHLPYHTGASVVGLATERHWLRSLAEPAIETRGWHLLPLVRILIVELHDSVKLLDLPYDNFTRLHCTPDPTPNVSTAGAMTF